MCLPCTVHVPLACRRAVSPKAQWTIRFVAGLIPQHSCPVQCSCLKAEFSCFWLQSQGPLLGAGCCQGGLELICCLKFPPFDCSLEFSVWHMKTRLDHDLRLLNIDGDSKVVKSQREFCNADLHFWLRASIQSWDPLNFHLWSKAREGPSHPNRVAEAYWQQCICCDIYILVQFKACFSSPQKHCAKGESNWLQGHPPPSRAEGKSDPQNPWPSLQGCTLCQAF